MRASGARRRPILRPRRPRARDRTRRSATRSCTSNRSSARRRVPTDDVGLEALKADLAGAEAARRASPTSSPTAATTATRRRAPPARRPASRRPTRFLAAGRAGDPRLEGLQGKRAARDHRRRGAVERANSPTRARAAAQPLFPERCPPSRSRARRAAAAPSVRCCSRRTSKARHDEPGTVQPLLAAAHDRGPVRPAAPRLRGRSPAVKSFEPSMFIAARKR